MARTERLRRFIKQSDLGIEVAPYCNPIAPRSAGHKTLIVDVFDYEQLIKNATADLSIARDAISVIEHVDIVCDASQIGDEIVRRGLERFPITLVHSRMI